MRNNQFPLFWINLDTCERRRRKMLFALTEGGWEDTKRWIATDAKVKNNYFITYPRIWQKSSDFSDLLLQSEVNKDRITSRSELACFTSWQLLIEHLNRIPSDMEWFLLMEDDVGSSLAVADVWPVNLNALIDQAGSKALVIQLAPINGNVRKQLYEIWNKSNQQCLVVPKSDFRSHGNGAVLVNRNALPILKRHIGRYINHLFSNLFLLGHPQNIRPVADKWLYASLKPEQCFIATFPIFCLEAIDSSINQNHVNSYHYASRKQTLEIWRKGNYKHLINAYEMWSKI